jgi:MinD-like ATPase involved in chromosome partitioning or flagellar assembly
MESISVAVALPSGEMASDIIAVIGGHPLLDLCGVARSVPDLMRLLERFRPAVLLISPSLLEELGPPGPGTEDAARLSAPVSFLISQAETEWGGERLADLLRLPLKYGGLIGAGGSSEGDLFDEIKRKLEIYRDGEGLPFFPSSKDNRPGGRSGLFTVMGCKGGVGTTLFSCALAAAMSSSGRRVLLMEMKRELSQLAYLKPRGEGKAVLDLFPLAEEISWDLVRVSVYRHTAGFHLLPYGNGDGPMAEAAVPEPLLRNLLFLFDLVIQDFPASSLRGFPPLLHHDPEVLLLSLPDTLAATCARGVAACLRRTGLDYDRLRLVVNRCGSHHTLSPQELAGAAAIELLASLPDDARSGLDFAELGELPRADSPLGRAVLETAAALGCGGSPAGKATTLRRLKLRWGRTDDNH